MPNTEASTSSSSGSSSTDILVRLQARQADSYGLAMIAARQAALQTMLALLVTAL
jgi:hypothetical protein